MPFASIHRDVARDFRRIADAPRVPRSNGATRLDQTATHQSFENGSSRLCLIPKQTEKSARTRTDTTRTPGVSCGTDDSNPSRSGGESGTDCSSTHVPAASRANRKAFSFAGVRLRHPAGNAILAVANRRISPCSNRPGPPGRLRAGAASEWRNAVAAV